MALVFNPFTGNFDVTGANQKLSNLQSPTAINQDLLPIAAYSSSLGSLAFPFFNTVSYNVLANTISNLGNNPVINLAASALLDSTGTDIINFQNPLGATTITQPALDNSGNIATTAYVDTAIGALPDPIVYKGTWDASTNTPALANTDTGVEGFLYQVNVAGTVNFGAGPISFEVGDKVVNNGSTWQKWDMTDSVVSVNGQTGIVSLTTTDVPEGINLYYTSVRFDTAFAAKTTTDLTEGTNLYFTDTRARTAAVQDTITNGVTDIAPSQNAVFDALALKATNPMTTAGDLIYGLTGGVPQRLAPVASGQILGSGTVPSWITPQSVAAASTVMARNPSAGVGCNYFAPSINTTVTVAGTTTLVVASAGTQIFTGTTTQTLVMPNPSTMAISGHQYFIKNNSTGVVTVNSSGGNLIQTMAPGSNMILTLISTGGGTTAAAWNVAYNLDGNGAVGANTALSNLASTAINADINPAADNVRTFGTAALAYARMYVNKLATSTGDQIDLGIRALQFNGASVASWFNNGIQLATSKILRFTDGTNTVGLQPPATLAASIDYTLPSAAPTVNGQALVPTTAGVKSFATVMTNPMTTGGDVIYGGASGVPTRLANGTSGQILTSTGGTTAPAWKDVAPWVSISSGLLTAGASGFVRAATAPSFGTISYNQARYYISGNTVYLEWDFKQTTAGTAGAGALYLLDLPTIGLPAVGSYSQPNVGSAFTDYTTPMGTIQIAVGGASMATGYAMPYSTTQVKFGIMSMTPSTAAAGTWAPALSGFNSSTFMVSVKISYTI